LYKILVGNWREEIYCKA